MKTMDKMKKVIYKTHDGNEFVFDELLPCPFCGEKPNLTFIGNAHTKSRKVKIKCEGCRVTLINAGIRSSSEQLAIISIRSWNNRTKDNDMKNEDYIKTDKWFAWRPVKTTNAGWIWWKVVNRTIDERPVVYLGLLPEYEYSL